jgi:hypothetical protein
VHRHATLVVETAPHDETRTCLLHADRFCVQNIAA